MKKKTFSYLVGALLINISCVGKDPINESLPPKINTNTPSVSIETPIYNTPVTPEIPDNLKTGTSFNTQGFPMIPSYKEGGAPRDPNKNKIFQGIAWAQGIYALSKYAEPHGELSAGIEYPKQAFVLSGGSYAFEENSDLGKAVDYIRAGFCYPFLVWHSSSIGGCLNATQKKIRWVARSWRGRLEAGERSSIFFEPEIFIQQDLYEGPEGSVMIRGMVRSITESDRTIHTTGAVAGELNFRGRISIIAQSTYLYYGFNSLGLGLKIRL